MLGTGFVVGMVAKIAVISAFGMGASAFMNFFNKYEYKPKKKGEKQHDDHDSESLRERARAIR